jgi:[protein-PII] uridylyltransferase
VDTEIALWRHLDTAYFQRHTAEEIAWHARHLYWRVDTPQPVVKARLSRTGAGLQLLAYLPDQKALFARISGFLGRNNLSILEAKVHTTRHGFALDTFVVHDPGNPAARGLRLPVAALAHAAQDAGLGRRLELEPAVPPWIPSRPL